MIVLDGLRDVDDVETTVQNKRVVLGQISMDQLAYSVEGPHVTHKLQIKWFGILK